MKFELFIAMKHMLRGKRQGFVSLISFISVLGIGVGVMALIVVLAVMSGFDKELKNKIVGVQPHIRVEGVGGIQDSTQVIQVIESLKMPDVTSLAPYIEGQAIVRSDQNAVGIVVKGIDPKLEPLGLFQEHLEVGTLSFDDVNAAEKSKQPEWIGRVVIGEELSKRLHVHYGDVVTLISPALEENSLKKAVKKARSIPFVVSGIYRIGMNDFDSGLALVHISKGQELYGMDERATGVGIRFLDAGLASEFKGMLQGRFGTGFVVQSWIDINRTFFGALQVEKTVMTILLSLIVLVAAFNVISTLIMSVKDKTKDIGILRALGATRGAVMLIFLIQGLVVGLFGILIGAAAGLALAFNLNPVSDFLERTFGISVFPSDIYYFDRIPADIRMPDVLLVAFFALLMSILAGWYPAHYASKLNPVSALRYE
jgi:lipoprotein-releasing system permease protein